MNEISRHLVTIALIVLVFVFIFLGALFSGVP